jgi:putative hemolysin
MKLDGGRIVDTMGRGLNKMASRSPIQGLRTGAGSERKAARRRTERIPAPEGIGVMHEGAYVVRFARNEADLDAVLRLRFEIFNRELGEGLAESWDTGRDEDSFDSACHHIMLIDRRSEELVGTYRVQTAKMARAAGGLYCNQEFDLSTLPEDVLSESIEAGRASVLVSHRNGTALFGLWRGLSAYLTWARAHLLFGCCSLTSQDPDEGASMLRRLTREGKVSPHYRVVPRPGFECVSTATKLPRVKMPKLFGTYMRYGGLVCGPPAIDRSFKTIDYLVLLDVDAMDQKMFSTFFE